MNARQPRYPSSIIADLMIEGNLTQGGSISAGFSGSFLQSPVDVPFGEFQTDPGKFYLSYIGRSRANITLEYANLRVTTPAAGTFVSGQLALLSGADPSEGVHTATCVQVTSLPGLVDLTTAGNKRITLNKPYYENTNLWIGVFIRYQTTQPKFFPLGRDYGCGLVRVGNTVIDDPFIVNNTYETAIAGDTDQTGIDMILHAVPW